jgi:hypothetical protein
MAMNGRVIGGSYLNSAVSVLPIGSGLVVQTGFKWRKLDPEHVEQWEDVTPEGGTSTIGVVGQAVAGALMPKFLGKGASAAVGAAVDAKMRPPHTIRVDWADGKQSLLKMPDELFTHMELLLRERRAEPTLHVVERRTSVPEQPGQASLGEQAFAFVSGIVADRLSDRGPAAVDTVQNDVEGQLRRLAALRDEGILTEEEFAAKKASLLSQM